MIWKTVLGVSASIVMVAVGATHPADAEARAGATPVSVHRSVSAQTSSDGSAVFEAEDAKLVVEPASEPMPSSSELSSMAIVLTCDLDVQNVHDSHHVNGTINEVAVISCKAKAAHLRLATEMYRLTPSYKKWTAGTKNQDNTASLQNNVAAPCAGNAPGTFRGWGWGTITPPAGYTLSGPADYAKYGNTTAVTCSTAQIAATSDPEPSGTRVTVTFIRSDIANQQEAWGDQ